MKKLGAFISSFLAYLLEKDIVPALIIKGIGAKQSHFDCSSNQIR